MNILPQPLKQGDTIGIAAVSGPADKKDLARGMNVIGDMGYHVKPADNLYSRRFYHAGTDRERADSLNGLLGDPSVRGIMFNRGGCGAYRILDMVDYSLLADDPRPVIGYSDLTYLLNAVNMRTGIVTFYGPVVAELGSESIAAGVLERILSGIPPEPVTFDSGDVIFEGAFRGVSAGGCLSLISSMMGTTWEPDLSNKLLFWEDVDEETHRIDRYLSQLKASGKLAGLGGMAVGDFECAGPSGKPVPDIRDIYREVFDERPFPVVGNLPFGHKRFETVIPLGAEVAIDTDSCIIDFGALWT